MSPTRIHVIGGPGSGKTTIGRRIADRIGVPAFELDEIAKAGPAPSFRMQSSLVDRLAQVRAISSLPGWVTEGTFLWWTDDLFRTADVVLWLDLPGRQAIRNVVKREAPVHLCREWLTCALQQPNVLQFTRALRHPHLRPLVAFLRLTWTYYHQPGIIGTPHPADLDSGWAVTRADTVVELDKYRHKLVRCTRRSEMDAFLERLGAACTA